MAAAIEKLEEGRALAGDAPNILGALGEAHARARNPAEARRLLARLHDIASQRPVSSTSFALIHLGLGEKNEALTWLESASPVRRCQLPLQTFIPLTMSCAANPASRPCCDA